MIQMNANVVIPMTPSASSSQMLTCHLSQRSTTKCGPHNANTPLQTLDELDAASMRVPGKQMKIR